MLGYTICSAACFHQSLFLKEGHSFKVHYPYDPEEVSPFHRSVFCEVVAWRRKWTFWDITLRYFTMDIMRSTKELSMQVHLARLVFSLKCSKPMTPHTTNNMRFTSHLWPLWVDPWRKSSKWILWSKWEASCNFSDSPPKPTKLHVNFLFTMNLTPASPQSPTKSYLPKTSIITPCGQ